MSGSQRYRKRPGVVEAIRFDGSNYLEVMAFTGPGHIDWDSGRIRVRTLHGVAVCLPGDWICKGLADCWPVDAKTFVNLYDLVEETP